jgi:hypothetical protein
VLAQISVRPGIKLPLLLNSITSSKANRAGQVVTARLVQNSPLAEELTSTTGNTIVGCTIELNATADASCATTAYQFDEFTAYKKHWPSPYAKNLFILLKMRQLFRLPNPVRATALPKRPRQTQSWAAQGAIAERPLRRFLNYHPTA